jgi:hypothetical protein
MSKLHRVAFLAFAFLLGGCATLGGARVDDAAAAAGVLDATPPGFATVHWVVYLTSFVMVAGAVALGIGGQVKTALTVGGTAVALMVTVAAAAYFGKALALAAALALGVTLLTAMALAAWFAFKYLRKKHQFGDYAEAVPEAVRALAPDDADKVLTVLEAALPPRTLAAARRVQGAE